MNLNNAEIIAERPTKTVYRDGDRCIKLFVEGYSKALILNEALNHARIEETGIKMPKLLEVTTVDGRWAIVAEYIEGKTLAELMAEHPEKEDEYLKTFVELQISVQSHTCPMLNKLKDKMNSKISQARLDATTRYELHVRLDGMPKHNKVCHGDFNPSNVIVSESGELYIIDWAHATQGNASADAARTYLLFCLEGRFDTAKKYLDLFCKESDTAKQYVQKWMPIVAASQSVKEKEKEREFLLNWVNVVDYE